MTLFAQSPPQKVRPTAGFHADHLHLYIRDEGQHLPARTSLGTTTREVLALREWLLSQGCTHVGMESTGVYWKPVYAILEGALEIVVVNANSSRRFRDARPT